MIQYNDNNIYVGFIKELLATFNLPKIAVWKDSMTDISTGLIDGKLYIKDNGIYKYTNGQFKYLTNYKLNKSILNITKKLELKNNIYDSYTHIYLGDYLRFIRDYLHLDLMSLYNCFTYDMPSNYNYIIKDVDSFNTSDNAYKLYMLPVKHNQKYLIAIDCNTSISCICDYYENNNIINFEGREGIVKESYKKIAGLKFSRPFVVDPENTSSIASALTIETPKFTKKNLPYENNLKLFIKVPKENTSSIVVLEGDYSQGCNIYFDDNHIAQIANNPLQYQLLNSSGDYYDATKYKYISKPSLLYLNTQNKVLLATRLIEYLSENVVDLLSEDYNIKKLQRRLSVSLDNAHRPIKKYLDFTYGYGVWNNKIQHALANFILDNKLNNIYLDTLFYMDKDIEKELGGII